MRFLPATLVTVAIVGEPVGATLLAILMLNEVPPLIEVLGGVVVLAGIFVAFRKRWVLPEQR